MQGEAVLGLEAAARSLVRPGTKVLNLVQGIFGKGMGYWLKDFGAELHEIEVPYNDAVDPADVERYLDEHPGDRARHRRPLRDAVGHAAATSPRSGRSRSARGALTLVDCVSSLGGIPLETDAWQLDVCVAGPQKCLGGPPGMSLMTVSDGGLGAHPGEPGRAPRPRSCRCSTGRSSGSTASKFPFTPSVSDLHGVEAACDELLEEGLEASIARHERAAPACRAGVRAMGLELWPRSDEIAAAVRDGDRGAGRASPTCRSAHTAASATA